MIKISVIVPIYNMEEYLADCLDSICNQSINDIEIICINDGSQDKSYEILKEYKNKDKRIIIINKKNEGVAKARNDGIRLANGEFVCFIDPDDLYPDKYVLEDLYLTAKRNGALICGGSFSHLDQRTGKIRCEYDGFYKPYSFSEDGYILYSNYQYDYGYHRFIYSLNLLKSNNIYFPDYKRFQDPPFFVNAMICARRFYAMKRISYEYRVGHQNFKWSIEKLTDFMKGISDNLRVSSELCLCDLHAVTVQRLIEQKVVFNYNKKYFQDIILYKQIIEILILIRMDLINKSIYQIDLKKLLEIYEVINSQFMELSKEVSMWKNRYYDIKQSETFRIGEILLWIPRNIILLFKAICDRKK